MCIEFNVPSFFSHFKKNQSNTHTTHITHTHIYRTERGATDQLMKSIETAELTFGYSSERYTGKKGA